MFGKKANIKSVSVDELSQNDVRAIIDVREPDEFQTGHISNVKNIPMFGLLMNAEQFLNKEKTYYIICQSGNRSHHVCEALLAQGYDVVNVLGGMRAYIQKYGKE